MNNTPDPWNDPLLLPHEADGIRELDNNLPRWWVWLFNLCIVFAVGYMLYYHVFHLGDLPAKLYLAESKQGDAIKAAALKTFEDSLPTLAPSKDPAVVGQGHDIFLHYCAPCHRADAGGLVGPNLCDDYWIHGSNFVDNLRTIVNGVPAKGMLTWRGVLKPKEIHAVASYIYTLRGTHPVNPKPPENQVQAPAANQYE
ncbi:MAG TPA: cbb3-type cytochrome c oxidase N-terminal domain-containing protein [Verrucomicrobiae bacterium]|jgi:cytochrome c oxidase cbb3-type subunit 3|nr:cbb3-type cytochrome c oxidase N-terminal domain-containing protein [Verrucomicrobiae bacterium]